MLRVNKQRVLGEFLRPEPPFTGVSSPSGPKIAEKNLKMGLFGGPEKSPRKYPQKSRRAKKASKLIAARAIRNAIRANRFARINRN